MKNIISIITILFFCIVCLVVCRISNKIRNSKRNGDTMQYFKYNNSMNNHISGDVMPLFSEALGKKCITSSRLEYANIIFFTLLTDYQKRKHILNNMPGVKYIYSLLSIDKMASKSNLVSVLASNLPTHVVESILPVSFILDNDEDMAKFKESFSEEKLYIVKKNIQRQQGCVLTNNFKYIVDSPRNGFVVCQEVVKDVFTVNARKINLRIYLLVICKESPSMFIYNNGFVYYSKMPYDANSTNPDVHITTGYIDRRVYDENPMTYLELKKTMKTKNVVKLDENIKKLISAVYNAYIPIITKMDGSSKTNFTICGCDIAVDSKMNCKLMEINKGPDLGSKDSRDRKVKYNLVLDTLIKVGIIDGVTNNFINVC